MHCLFLYIPGLLQAISTANSTVAPSDKFMIAIDSAYRQESANRYIHALEQSVIVKLAVSIWSAFL